MLQSKSPLLDIFEGLYTYGQPRIGDDEFAKVFGPNLSSKIFHHALNNGKLLNFFFFAEGTRNTEEWK